MSGHLALPQDSISTPQYTKLAVNFLLFLFPSKLFFKISAASNSSLSPGVSFAKL